MKRIAVLSGLLFALSAAHAAGVDGTWQGSFSSESGEPRQVRAELKDDYGNWTTLAGAGAKPGDPCVGKGLPVEVKPKAPNAATLNVGASMVVPACKDFRLELHVVDGKTLEGQFADGRKIRLQRIR